MEKNKSQGEKINHLARLYFPVLKCLNSSTVVARERLRSIFPEASAFSSDESYKFHNAFIRKAFLRTIIETLVALKRSLQIKHTFLKLRL